MTIAATNIKMRKSQRLTDNADGGGRMVQAEVEDGVLNNLFPNIGDEERTTGRTVLRKAFVHVDTPDTDVLKDAIGVILRQPEDSKITMVMMGLGSYSDTRSEARDRIESYTIKGVESRYVLLGNHFVGQQSLQVYCMADAATPEISDNWCLATAQSGYPAAEQYVRISKILSRTSQTFYDDRGAFERDVIIVEIASALLVNFYGMSSPNRFSNEKPPTRVHETNIVEAATYATVKALTEEADAGALSVKVDSPYVPIVPAATAETPVVDLQAGQGTVSYVQAGPTDGLSVTFSSAFAAGVSVSRSLGNPLVKGATRATVAALELLDDGGGRLASASPSPWSGTVDYATGTVAIQHESGASSTAVTIVATAAGPVTDQGYTQRQEVTQGNVGIIWLFNLVPLPAPGTVVVDYRALGRWIRLTDTGTGQLAGRPGEGTGTINYATGAVMVTCGSLPDINSEMLVSWGTGVICERRDGDVAIQPPRLSFLLGQGGIKPGSEWLVSAAPVTAVDDGAGVIELSGTPIGYVVYATGEVSLQLTTLPDSNSTISASYDYSDNEVESFTPVPDGGGIGSIALPVSPVRAGSVAMRWQVTVRPATEPELGAPAIALTIVARDDGAGLIKAVSAGGAAFTATLGTINYTTGEISCQFGQMSIPNVPMPNYINTGGFGGGDYWRIQGRTRAAVTASFSPGTLVTAEWQSAVAADSSETEDLALPPVRLDLTPGVIDAIVPGSVRFTFKGRTYVDRSGSLYSDINPVTGAGTFSGTLDYASGQATISLWTAGGSNAVSIQALLTRLFEPGTDAMYFRTPGSPLRAGVFTLRANTLDGTLITATADVSGNLTGTLIDGTVDWGTGTVAVRFGEMVTAAGNESEPWYDPDNVVGPNVWRPQLVIPSSVYLGAVVFRSIPLSSVVVGLDPTRLPSDGRVPGFRAGQTVLIHHSEEVTVSPTPGQVVDLGREDLSEIEIRDSEGVPVLSAWYALDLDAGTVSFTDPLNLSGYTLPLKIRHSIENRRLCAGVQITGDIEINAALSRDFPMGTLISSAVRLGEANGSLDLQARVQSLFDINTWNANVWLDALGPGQSAAPATFNEVDYPLIVTNADAITERWALVFTNSATYSVVGETVGTIVTGQSIAADCAPINPRTGQPYFTIDKDGFGGGWATNNAVRFNTIGGLAPLWFSRCTLPGTPETDSDYFRFKTIGNIEEVAP